MQTKMGKGCLVKKLSSDMWQMLTCSHIFDLKSDQGQNLEVDTIRFFQISNGVTKHGEMLNVLDETK